MPDTCPCEPVLVLEPIILTIDLEPIDLILDIDC